MSATPAEDPRAELSQLAAGLAGHVRRARAAGKRSSSATKTPSKPAPASSTSAGAHSAADVRAEAAACTDLESLRGAVARCTACSLSKTRTQTVFMDGKGTRRLMFIGEAPGADEDRTGVPFVGRAGQLLTDIITKGMGLARDEVLIANVLKCRPPENREPTSEEKATCTPWLDRQIELTDPAVIIPLGRHAAMHVLQVEGTMGSLRGKVHLRAGRPVVPTFHPAYLLRSPGEKKECWKDIQVAMGVLGIAPPAQGQTQLPPAPGNFSGQAG